jgi:NodT family efflux transporter outer membrane factor (OMF) lipoprotein
MMMRSLFVVLAGSGLVSGCVVGPDYTPPQADLPGAFHAPLPVADGEAQPVWWQGFDDPELARLIALALDDNLDIALARARLDEADALVTRAQAGLAPSLDASASAVLSGDGSDESSAGLGLGLSYMPDLFGGQRRRIEQAEATRQAREFALADARRLTAAAIAGRYIEWQRSRARLALLETSLDLQRQTLDIVERRAEAGLSADLDVQRAASDLARTRAERGSLDVVRAAALHDLAVLTGQIPGEASLSGADTAAIPHLSRMPLDALPADLLRQRPDLQAAERQLAAASAAVGIAEADLYPSLSLPGSITADLGSADRLVSSVMARLGASLTVPLTDGGARRAGIEAAEARLDQARLSYRAVLLNALAEVETALVQLQAVDAQVVELETAVTASEQAFEQLNALYREGLASFIDILDAQRTLISSREAQLDARADQTAALVDLYRVLGAPVSPAAAPATRS